MGVFHVFKNVQMVPNRLKHQLIVNQDVILVLQLLNINRSFETFEDMY